MSERRWLEDENERFEAERRRDRVEEMTPAPSSLSPKAQLQLRHQQQLRELEARHAEERKELHDPDCERHAHGGPCHGPLRFELPETPLERYERHITAIEAVLIRADVHGRIGLGPEGVERRPLTGARLRELAEACYAAADTGI